MRQEIVLDLDSVPVVFCLAERPDLIVSLGHLALHDTRVIHRPSMGVNESPNPGHMGAQNIWQSLHENMLVVLLCFMSYG